METTAKSSQKTVKHELRRAYTIYIVKNFDDTFRNHFTKSSRKEIRVFSLCHRSH